MPCRAMQNPCIFVLHFALDDPVPKRIVNFGWRDQGSLLGGRRESRCRETEWLEYLVLRPERQIRPRQDLQRLAQQDEARVGVLSAFARCGFDRKFKARAIELCGSGD